MFNLTFFFGMVCSEPTWVTKDGKDELQFLVSSVDKEKMRSMRDFENNPDDDNERPEMNFVQIPVIVSNPNFGEKLMNEKRLGKGSMVYVEGTLTSLAGVFGSTSVVAVAARTVKIEPRNKPQFQQSSPIQQSSQSLPVANLPRSVRDDEQPPINPARKQPAYGRPRNE